MARVDTADIYWHRAFDTFLRCAVHLREFPHPAGPRPSASPDVLMCCRGIANLGYRHCKRRRLRWTHLLRRACSGREIRAHHGPIVCCSCRITSRAEAHARQLRGCDWRKSRSRGWRNNGRRAYRAELACQTRVGNWNGSRACICC
jgi:hypothetical protein